MLNRKSVRIGIIVSIIIMGIVYKCCTMTHPIDELIFQIDGQLAKPTKVELKESMHQLIKNNLDLSQLASTLIQQYPFIESVTVQRLVPATILIQVDATRPCYRINNSLVWTNNNHLVDRALFQSWAYDCCPVINLVDESLSRSVPLLTELLPLLPEDLLPQARIIIHDRWNVIIRPNAQHSAIKCSINTIPTDQMIKTCTNITKQLEKEQKGNCNKCGRWIADIRFRDQIILQADRGA